MTVHFAETLFRWLMRAYPARFRRTHGLALFELFRDEARDAHNARGTKGLVTLIARTAADTLKAAPGAWFRHAHHDERPSQLHLDATPLLSARSSQASMSGQTAPLSDWLCPAFGTRIICFGPCNASNTRLE